MLRAAGAGPAQAPASAARRASAAGRPTPRAAALIGLQRTAGNRAVGAMLARGVLQRSIDDWSSALFETIGDTLSGGVATVEKALGSAGKKAATLADLATYPSCESTLGGPAPKPALDAWLDNKGLEVLRHGDGELLSRTREPSGGDRGATRLVKQALHAWGCETLGRDLLPKHGTGGPFGPETAGALEQFQLFTWQSVDGVLGPETLAALDAYLGVRPASRTPASVGGTKEKGRSTWSPIRVPAGRIYFATDGATLDSHDQAVLESMADEFASPKRKVEKITLNVVGYADKRESARHNVELSDRRAAAVRDHLAELLTDRGVDFGPAVTKKAKGEIERPQVGETEEELKPFRRADVHIVDVVYRSPADEGPGCEQPTTEWEAQLRNMQTFGGLVTGTVGVVAIRTRNPDAGGHRWMRTYKYAGGGPGFSPAIKGKSLPSGVTGDSDFVPFSTSVPLTLSHFAGSATHSAASAVVGSGYGYDALEVDGIRDHGAKTVTIEWSGPSSGLSVGLVADVWGRLTTYKRCEEVEPEK